MNEKERMEFFYEIFDPKMPRLGPGDNRATEKALNTVLAARNQREHAHGSNNLTILDIGCGNGTQTIQLAKRINGTIQAVDNHQPYLDELQRRAEAADVAEKILIRRQDMNDLRQEDGSYDVIWSEGALYIMGFRDGLAVCHRLLGPKGLLAVSELVWLRPDPPEECRQYFADAYPALVDVQTNLVAATDCGFDILGHFKLSESAWWNPYYHPLEERLQVLRRKYSEDREKMAMIESVQTEIEMYRKYSNYYGYEFYLMQRR